MSRVYDVRCQLPATYRPGKCDQMLFRITSTGGLEVKCHNCRRVQMIHRSALDTYHRTEVIEWSHYG